MPLAIGDLFPWAFKGDALPAGMCWCVMEGECSNEYPGDPLIWLPEARLGTKLPGPEFDGSGLIDRLLPDELGGP